MSSMPPAPIFGVSPGPGEAGTSGVSNKYINIDEIFKDCFIEGDPVELLVLDGTTGTGSGADISGAGADGTGDVGVIGAESGLGTGGLLAMSSPLVVETGTLGNPAMITGLSGGPAMPSAVINSSGSSSAYSPSTLGGIDASSTSGTQGGTIGAASSDVLQATQHQQQLAGNHFVHLPRFGAGGPTAVEAAVGLAPARPGLGIGRGGVVRIAGGGTAGGVSVSTGVGQVAVPRVKPGAGGGVPRVTGAGGSDGARGGGGIATMGGAGGSGSRSASMAGLDDDEEEEEEKVGRRGGGGGGKRPRQGGRNMTEQQRLDRRERNREHAKRSRVRKKFLLESLQKSVTALQEENEKLRGAIRSNLGAEEAEELLEQTETSSLIASNPGDATKVLDDPDYSLVKALQTAQQNFVITDPTLPDNPIVFASQGFLELTGYTLDQVLGRNCRFLQGPDTDPKAIEKIRKAIEKGMDTSVCLRNYRVDGAMFWNQFFIAALRDSEGAVINYVGVQCKVDEDFVRAVQKREGEDEGDDEDVDDDDDRSDADDKAA